MGTHTIEKPRILWMLGRFVNPLWVFWWQNIGSNDRTAKTTAKLISDWIIIDEVIACQFLLMPMASVLLSALLRALLRYVLSFICRFSSFIGRTSSDLRCNADVSLVCVRQSENPKSSWQIASMTRTCAFNNYNKKPICLFADLTVETISKHVI